MGEQAFFIAVFSSAVIAGTPILFAALGELVTERAGVMNLGVEGMMLIGAVTGFMAAIVTGNVWLGMAAAMFAGGVMGLIQAILTVSLRANQVVSGLALTLFGTDSADIWENLILGFGGSSFRSVALRCCLIFRFWDRYCLGMMYWFI